MATLVLLALMANQKALYTKTLQKQPRDSLDLRLIIFYKKIISIHNSDYVIQRQHLSLLKENTDKCKEVKNMYIFP